MFTIQQQSALFLWNTAWNLLVEPLLGLVRRCRRNHRQQPEPLLPLSSFLPACQTGEVEQVKRVIASHSVDLNEGLLEAVKHKQEAVVRYLVEQGAKNIDEALRMACMNGNYSLAELLVQKGANVVVGLRVSKSPNITKMLYRYEQKTENIN